MNEGITHFIEAMCSAGLTPPESIYPGKIHRFPGINKGANNRAGWCKLFDDGQGGCFGDWSSGLYEVWHTKREKLRTSQERAAFARRMAEVKVKADAELKAIQSNAANRARILWRKAVLAPTDHPYLIKKGIHPHGARLYKSALVLPVVDFHGTLVSLQFIASNGSKLLLSGGRKKGCFIPVAGDRTSFSRVIICEGWATGCALAEDEPAALVLAAIDAGNLEQTAVSARQLWPSDEIVVAGDDDRLTPGNPGATKARAASIAADALLALPSWPAGVPDTLTDFNDLAQWISGGRV